jgi:hypothetical protein
MYTKNHIMIDHKQPYMRLFGHDERTNEYFPINIEYRPEFNQWFFYDLNGRGFVELDSYEENCHDICCETIPEDR